MKKCFCRGVNENCDYCSGTGYMPDASDVGSSGAVIRGPQPVVKSGKRQVHQVFGGGGYGQGYAIAPKPATSTIRKAKRQKKRKASPQKVEQKIRNVSVAAVGQAAHVQPIGLFPNRHVTSPKSNVSGPASLKDSGLKPDGGGVSRRPLLIVSRGKLTEENKSFLEEVFRINDPHQVYCFGHRSVSRFLRDKLISAMVIEVSNEANVKDLERNPKITRFELLV